MFDSFPPPRIGASTLHRFVVTGCLLALIGCPIGLAGCGGKKGSGKKAAVKAGKQDVVVARIGERTITAGQVAEALSRQNAYTRMRFSSLARKKAFLEKLVRFEVLVAEAEKRGLQNHPDVLRRQKRAMVEILMKRLNKELVSFDDIKEAEIKARYERDEAKYRRPKRLRGAVLLLPSEAEAKQVLAELAKQQNKARYFGMQCKQRNTHPMLKKRAGDLGFFAKDCKVDTPRRYARPGAPQPKAKEQQPQVVPKALCEAVFGLAQAGDVAGPLKLDKGSYGGGWALVMRTGELPPLNRPYKLVRDRIKNQLFHEKRFKAVTGYADKLKAKAKIVIDDKALEAVKPPGPGQAPKLPGMTPPMRPGAKRPPKSGK